MLYEKALFLFLFSSVLAYNEEEEEANLFVKPSISFKNVTTLSQTPPRRSFNIPRPSDPVARSTTSTTQPTTSKTTTPRAFATSSRTTTIAPTTHPFKAAIPFVNR
jgi:hypothetical protein